jgi:hypothetical protein
MFFPYDEETDDSGKGKKEKNSQDINRGIGGDHLI